MPKKPSFNIPRKHNLFISLSNMFLSSSLTWYGLIKKGDLSLMSISTSILEQVPISSLKLNVSLYLCNISTTYFFSVSDRQDLSKSMYLSSISLSDMSSCSSHGYYSFVSSFSFFNVFTNFVNCSHKSLISTHILLQNS